MRALARLPRLVELCFTDPMWGESPLAALCNYQTWVVLRACVRVGGRARVCMHVCVRACVRACVRVCVRACVRVCVRVCVRACVRACGRAGGRTRAIALYRQMQRALGAGLGPYVGAVQLRVWVALLEVVGYGGVDAPF